MRRDEERPAAIDGAEAMAAERFVRNVEAVSEQATDPPGVGAGQEGDR